MGKSNNYMSAEEWVMEIMRKYKVYNTLLIAISAPNYVKGSVWGAVSTLTKNGSLVYISGNTRETFRNNIQLASI